MVEYFVGCGRHDYWRDGCPDCMRHERCQFCGRRLAWHERTVTGIGAVLLTCKDAPRLDEPTPRESPGEEAGR